MAGMLVALMPAVIDGDAGVYLTTSTDGSSWSRPRRRAQPASCPWLGRPPIPRRRAWPPITWPRWADRALRSSLPRRLIESEPLGEGRTADYPVAGIEGAATAAGGALRTGRCMLVSEYRKKVFLIPCIIPADPASFWLMRV